jgi:hypothetical protein
MFSLLDCEKVQLRLSTFLFVLVFACTLESVAVTTEIFSRIRAHEELLCVQNKIRLKSETDCYHQNQNLSFPLTA